jgi:hypothetical protein
MAVKVEDNGVWPPTTLKAGNYYSCLTLLINQTPFFEILIELRKYCFLNFNINFKPMGFIHLADKSTQLIHFVR